jgi:hypothetical protein
MACFPGATSKQQSRARMARVYVCRKGRAKGGSRGIARSGVRRRTLQHVGRLASPDRRAEPSATGGAAAVHDRRSPLIALPLKEILSSPLFSRLCGLGFGVYQGRLLNGQPPIMPAVISRALYPADRQLVGADRHFDLTDWRAAYRALCEDPSDIEDHPGSAAATPAT